MRVARQVWLEEGCYRGASQLVENAVVASFVGALRLN
jgi:hypothetical protein